MMAGKVAQLCEKGHRAVFEGFTNASDLLRPGIYILLHRGVVIYVGKSKKMLARVYTHENRYRQKRVKNKKAGLDFIPVPGIQFDEVHVRPARLEDLDRLEAEYIDRFKPRYNTQLKRPGAPAELRVGKDTLHFRAQGPKIERRL